MKKIKKTTKTKITQSVKTKNDHFDNRYKKGKIKQKIKKKEKTTKTKITQSVKTKNNHFNNRP